MRLSDSQHLFLKTFPSDQLDYGALPSESSIAEKASPQRVKVDDSLSSPLFVSFTESSH